MGKKSKKVRIFSALEVANICGVVNQTAINWVKNGHLKAFTTPGGQYRIYAEDFVVFLKDRGMRIPAELAGLLPVPAEKKILIIDDDKDLNDVLHDYFLKKLSEFVLFQAFDGFEAGKVLQAEKPDIIILDIDLPGIDGHTLCSRIKADKDLGTPTIISISGLNDSIEEEKILSEGADAFFPKPLNFEKVIDAIMKLQTIEI